MYKIVFRNPSQTQITFSSQKGTSPERTQIEILGGESDPLILDLNWAPAFRDFPPSANTDCSGSVGAVGTEGVKLYWVLEFFEFEENPKNDKMVFALLIPQNAIFALGTLLSLSTLASFSL